MFVYLLRICDTHALTLQTLQVFPRSRDLNHWGRVTHICYNNINTIGSNTVLPPWWCQAITLTNVGILLIWPLAANFSEMLIEIHTFAFKKMHRKCRLRKCRLHLRLFCVRYEDHTVQNGVWFHRQASNLRTGRIYQLSKMSTVFATAGQLYLPNVHFILEIWNTKCKWVIFSDNVYAILVLWKCFHEPNCL